MAETLAWNFVGNDEITGLLSKMDRLIEKLDRDFTGMGRSAKTAAAGLATTEKAADGLGDELDRAARKADDLAGELDGVRRAGGQLDVQIEATKKRIRELAQELDRTGDQVRAGELFGDLTKARGQLSALTRVAKELGEAGIEGGKRFSKGFLDAVESLPPQVKGLVYIVGGVLAAGLAPVIGGVVSAAVVGGVGAGGLIGGIALAASRPEVKAAGAAFADQIEAAFAPIGEQFADPLIDALDILGDSAEKFASKLDLGPLAAELPGLAKGIDEFAEAIQPGLNKALATAATMARILGAELGELGDAAGDVLGDLASNEGTLTGFAAALELTEIGVRVLGGVLNAFAGQLQAVAVAGAFVTGVFEDAFGWLPIVGDAWGSMNNKLEGMLGAADRSPAALAALLNGLRQAASAGDDLAKSLQATDDALDAIFNRSLSVAEGAIRVEKAIDDLGAAFAENGKSLDINTEKGRANQTALNDGIAAIEGQYKAMRAASVEIGVANAWRDAQYQRLVASAVAHGGEAAAIWAIINAIRVLNTQPKSTTHTVKFLTDTSGYNPPGRAGRQYAYAEGGIVGPGLPAGTPVDATVHAGELVIPQDLAARIFNLDRSLSSPRPASAALPAGITGAGHGGGGGGGPGVVHVVVDLMNQGQLIRREIQRDITIGSWVSLESYFGIPATGPR